MKNPPHPGKILHEAITEGLGKTITAVAEELGVSRKALSELVNGRSSISQEMAIRLEKGIGSTAAQWLRLQHAYDVAQITAAAKKRVKVKKIEPA